MCIQKDLIEKAKKKGRKMTKDLSFHVIAIGFNKKNELLGIKSNGFGLSIRKGSGKHAERELIKRYKDNIAKIIICRFGRDGKILPIDPCTTCQKLCDKMGIKVETYYGEQQ